MSTRAPILALLLDLPLGKTSHFRAEYGSIAAGLVRLARPGPNPFPAGP